VYIWTSAYILIYQLLSTFTCAQCTAELFLLNTVTNCRVSQEAMLSSAAEWLWTVKDKILFLRHGELSDTVQFHACGEHLMCMGMLYALYMCMYKAYEVCVYV